MTVERENFWLKVIVATMTLAAILGVAGHLHLRWERDIAFDSMVQQVKLWELRCRPQQAAALQQLELDQ